MATKTAGKPGGSKAARGRVFANKGHSPRQCVRLTGKVAIVTGGGRGIGRAVCERLASEGARVAVFDINRTGAEETCRIVTAAGGSATAYVVDVTRRTAVAKAVKAVIARFGRIDVLVNNAGLARQKAFLALADKDWRDILELNLTGYFIVGQEVGRQMVRQRDGRIINMASLAAHYAADLQAAYAAAKGGVVALTQVMAFELAPKGVNVNAVSPGAVATEMSAKNMSAASRRAREARIPQGRLATPSDIAASIAFLASDDASHINGTTLIVDGGMLIAGIREA